MFFSSSSSLLSSQIRTFFSLFLFEEVEKGVENRERYPFLDSLPERQSLLRFTTVFRKMYRRAPRYTTNCPSLVCCLVSPFLAIFTITDFADRDDYLLEERGEREKKFLAKSGDRCIVSVDKKRIRIERSCLGRQTVRRIRGEDIQLVLRAVRNEMRQGEEGRKEEGKEKKKKKRHE